VQTLAENETKEILQRLASLETLIKTTLVTTDRRLDKIEENQTWLWRTLIGGFVGYAIAFFSK
jgi:hypothetical protein